MEKNSTISSELSDYQRAVLHVVRSIPVGKVMSYGQVAVYVGTPRAAREVGWALHSLDGVDNFPWWRVLNNAGKITIKEEWDDKPRIQMQHLQDEGVEVSDYELDMKRYRYIPDEVTLRSYKLDPDAIAAILTMFDDDPQPESKQISLFS